jgi:cytochrome P450
MVDIVFKPLPGPAPETIGGARKQMAEFVKAPLRYMLDANKRFGDLVGLVKTDSEKRMPPLVFGFGPVINELVSDQTKFRLATSALYPAITRTPEYGPVAVSDLASFEKADLIESVATPDWLTRYHEAAGPLITSYVDSWEPRGSGEAFDIHAEMREVARELSLGMVFGMSSEDKPAEIARLLADVQAQTLILEAPALLTGTGADKKLAARATESLQRIVSRAANASGEPVVVAALIAARREDGVSLTDDELYGTLAGLYPAVESGIAALSTWAIFLLSQHPRIMAQLQDELAASLKGPHIVVDQLMQLPILEGIVRETTRLFPPKPFGARQASEPVAIDDWMLPQDTVCVYSPYVTHLDPTIYDKPEQFLPHRYKYYSPSIFELLPFGDVAPVTELVVYAVKLIVASIFRRHRLSLTKDQTINRRIGVVLEPAGPIAVSLVPDGMVFPVIPAKGGAAEAFKTT